MKIMRTMLFLILLSPLASTAEQFEFDPKGMHAFIDFRIQHLGFSWMSGRFNHFTGHFSYDEHNPAAAPVLVTIDTNSIDTNHAEHLRDDDFLAVKQFPKAIAPSLFC